MPIQIPTEPLPPKIEYAAKSTGTTGIIFCAGVVGALLEIPVYVCRRSVLYHASYFLPHGAPMGSRVLVWPLNFIIILGPAILSGVCGLWIIFQNSRPQGRTAGWILIINSLVWLAMRVATEFPSHWPIHAEFW